MKTSPGPSIETIKKILNDPGNPVRRYDIRQMCEAILSISRNLDEHRAGAVVSCDQECFCWQVEGWLARMDKGGA